jgi:WD40 repeat protein
MRSTNWTRLFAIAVSPFINVFAHAQQPEIILQTGHSATVNVVAFSSDGQYAFSGSADRTIKVWHSATGREVATLDGLTEPVNTLHVSADGMWLLSGGEDKTVTIWDIKYRSVVRKIPASTSRIDVAVLSPDQKWLASAGSGGDNTIRIWDPQTGKLIAEFNRHAYGVNALAFTPDSKHLVSAGGDKVICIWDLSSKTLLRAFKRDLDFGSSARIRALAISPDGKTIAAGMNKFKKDAPSITLWDFETGNVIKDLLKEGFFIYDLAFSKDGTRLLAGSGSNGGAENLARIWDVTSGALVFSTPAQKSAIYSCAFSPDEQYVLLSGYSSMQLFSVATGREVRNFYGLIDAQRALISADGHFLIQYGGKVLRVWDLRTGAVVKTFTHDDLYINAVALSPDGRLLWVSTSNNNIFVGTPEINQGHLLAFPSLEILKTEHLNFRIGVEAVFSNDGKSVAFSSKEGRVVWYDVVKQRTAKNLFPGFNQIYGLKFSSDSRLLFATGIGESVTVWDLYKPGTDGSPPTIRKSPKLGIQQHALDVSPDQKTIASSTYWVSFNARYAQVMILDTDSLKLRKNLGGHANYVQALHYSLDGKTLFTGSKDKTIKAWNTSGWQVERTFTGHTGAVQSVQPFPDGKQLLTASADGTARIWSVQTGKEATQFVGFREKDTWLTITPDGFYFGSKGAFDKVHYLRNGKIYSFDQFDLQYNRPDLVLQRMSAPDPKAVAAYRKAWEKRIRKMGFDPVNFEKTRSFNAPEITLAKETALFTETKQPAFAVAFAAKDALFNLDRVFVDINGVPVFGLKGKQISPKAKSVKFTETVALAEGRNVIKISVLNEKGVASLAERIEVIYSPSEPVKPNLHVIAIGVSKFKESEFNLTYADKDANDLSTLFKNAAGLYGRVTVHTLTNENATRANVLKLRAELDKTSVDDEVIVFTASHGVLDDDLDYYLAMHDMDFANPKKGGLRYDELENLLDAIPARNKLVLIDACHSGELDKEESQLTAVNEAFTAGVKSRAIAKKVVKKENIGLAASFELMKELFADLRRNNGAVVISSASGKEYAFESSEWANGVFTYAVLEGIKSGKADLNGDKTVSVSELRDYVSKRVQELTAGKQNPTSRTENLENDFSVW